MHSDFKVWLSALYMQRITRNASNARFYARNATCAVQRSQLMQEVANDMAGICHVIWLVSNKNVLFLSWGMFWTLRCLCKPCIACVALRCWHKTLHCVRKAGNRAWDMIPTPALVSPSSITWYCQKAGMLWGWEVIW